MLWCCFFSSSSSSLKSPSSDGSQTLNGHSRTTLIPSTVLTNPRRYSLRGLENTSSHPPLHSTHTAHRQPNTSYEREQTPVQTHSNPRPSSSPFSGTRVDPHQSSPSGLLANPPPHHLKGDTISPRSTGGRIQPFTKGLLNSHRQFLPSLNSNLCHRTISYPPSMAISHKKPCSTEESRTKGLIGAPRASDSEPAAQSFHPFSFPRSAKGQNLP
jgi:hypothetical protein